jgi:hypothetical protein
MMTMMGFQGVGMAIAGFIIGFERSWNTAAVTIAVVPLLVLVFVLFFIVLVKSEKIMTKAYASAGGLANEVSSAAYCHPHPLLRHPLLRHPPHRLSLHRRPRSPATGSPAAPHARRQPR